MMVALLLFRLLTFRERLDSDLQCFLIPHDPAMHSDYQHVHALRVAGIVAELKRERDRLNLPIAALDGHSPQSAARTSAVPRRATHCKKKGDRLSPASRKRLSDMMKQRWAERRKKGSKRQ